MPYFIIWNKAVNILYFSSPFLWPIFTGRQDASIVLQSHSSLHRKSDQIWRFWLRIFRRRFPSTAHYKQSTEKKIFRLEMWYFCNFSSNVRINSQKRRKIWGRIDGSVGTSLSPQCLPSAIEVKLRFRRDLWKSRVTEQFSRQPTRQPEESGCFEVAVRRRCL